MTQPADLEPRPDRAARLAALKQELVGGLLLSPAEVGEILDVHQRTVLDYIHSGRLRAWQLGGSWKIPEQGLRDFLERARRGGIDPDKRSPFETTSWKGDSYRVQIDGIWYEPLTIDALPFMSVLDFAKRTYGRRWQKRVDEDLVETMRLLGHDPAAVVSLRLRTVDGGDEVELPRVAMTHEKRQLIWRRRNRHSEADG